jgi:3-dehydroquinate synthase
MKNSQIETIKVSASKSYDVVIGSGLLKNTGEYLLNVLSPCKVAVITDDTVEDLYANKVINSIEKSGFKVVKFVFSHGEGSKNLNTYGEILSFLASSGVTRTDAVIALGGGVVGDMAGFAAATYLRGVKYIQIPTTLLSQIDSSVGGKTAIDLIEGKNLVGAFCQPSLVLCDTDTLSTLPKEIFIDGMGEVAKYALLDKKVFDLIENGEYDIQRLVYLCVDYKRRVVEQDEFESGKRKLLNLGHTPAHGIEKLSGYTLSHGKAVGIGLKIMLSACLNRGYIDRENYLKMSLVLDKCVGNVSCPYSVSEILTVAQFDKKRSGDYITLMTIYGVEDIREEKIKLVELEGFFK